MRDVLHAFRRRGRRLPGPTVGPRHGRRGHRTVSGHSTRLRLRRISPRRPWTETSVTLSWQASTDAGGVAGYRVVQDGAVAGLTGSTSYTAAGLTCGKSYDVRRRGVRRKRKSQRASGHHCLDCRMLRHGAAESAEPTSADCLGTHQPFGRLVCSNRQCSRSRIRTVRRRVIDGDDGTNLLQLRWVGLWDN